MTVPPKGSRYWESDKTWWRFSSNERVGITLTENAPPEAVDSFKIWKAWREAEMDRFLRTGILV